MLPQLSPPPHHLARRGWGLRSKCLTPRSNPAEEDCSDVPPDLCSRRLRSPPAIIPPPSPRTRPPEPPILFPCSGVKLSSQCPDAADRYTGSRIRTQPPHQPSRLHPRRVVPRGGSSRRVAGTPSAAAAMPDPRLLPVLEASARAPRGCPAPSLALCFLALIRLAESHLQ